MTTRKIAVKARPNFKVAMVNMVFLPFDIGLYYAGLYLAGKYVVDVAIT